MIARITANDDSALAAVADQYGPLVHGIARHLVGEAEAADVCQDVLLALWQHPERFDPERGSLRTFLATIAHRRAVDTLRRSHRRVANERRALAGRPDGAPDIEHIALSSMTADRIRSALADLPDTQRRAIELAYFGGLTYRQVAVETGTSEGTAKSRLRLGLGRLAGILGSMDVAGAS